MIKKNFHLKIKKIFNQYQIFLILRFQVNHHCLLTEQKKMFKATQPCTSYTMAYAEIFPGPEGVGVREVPGLPPGVHTPTQVQTAIKYKE